MTPKSLLRHPEARSNFDEMSVGTHFHPVISEPNGNANMRKLIFCSGKVYYDLKKARGEKELNDQIAIARVEQISPFPYDCVQKEVNKYPNAEIMWAQEEHKNNGAWTYVQPRMKNLLHKDVKYAGRQAAASPATGSKHQHLKEQAQLYADAFA